jgi:hypothetical protein
MSSHGRNEDAHKPTNTDHGYETTDAHAKPLIVFAVVLTVFTLSCFAGGFVTFKVLEYWRSSTDPGKHPMAAARQLPEGMPKLQILEAKDLAAFRKTENEKLSTYGWVSRETGKVRVPIEKAMSLVLKKGQLKARA